MKKKKVTANDLLNLWLTKYHNTTIEEVVLLHPEVSKTPDWFKLYPCTNAQSNEWVDECKALLKKDGYSTYVINHDWPYVFLDIAPYTNDDAEQTKEMV